jgi:SAM-dependent methyltransferase
VSAPDVSADEARRAIAENPVWYHTIELAPGVATPGYVDLRKVAARVLPDDLTGKRALDIGTFDGFWAFEMERRGAEVVTIDVETLDAAEWPPHRRAQLLRESEEQDVKLGRGFRIASELLGSSVERVVCNIYDVAPERIGGPVDLVFIGTLLLHLRDPVRGLERAGQTLRPGGELRLFEPIDVRLTLTSPRAPAARFSPMHTPFNWWLPNLRCLEDYLGAAQLGAPRRVCLTRPPARREMRQWYAAYACDVPG